MRKKLSKVALSVSVITGLFLFVGEAQVQAQTQVQETNLSAPGGIVYPDFTYLASNFQQLTIQNAKATLTAQTVAKRADSVRIGASLQQYKNGAWVEIKSWSASKNGTSVFLSNTWYVASGNKYRLVTVHTAYFQGNIEEEVKISSTISS